VALTSKYIEIQSALEKIGMKIIVISKEELRLFNSMFLVDKIKR